MHIASFIAYTKYSYHLDSHRFLQDGLLKTNILLIVSDHYISDQGGMLNAWNANSKMTVGIQISSCLGWLIFFFFFAYDNASWIVVFFCLLLIETLSVY